MPGPRSEMRRIREVLRLRAALGQNITAIAAGASMSRSTVREYLQRAKAAGMDAAKAAGLSEEALEAALFAPAKDGGRPLPDWGKLDEELDGTSTSPVSCCGTSTRPTTPTATSSASSSSC